MNSDDAKAPSLLSVLLLLPDGRVLTSNLTPAMAEALAQLGLEPDASSQHSLGAGSLDAPAARNRRRTRTDVKLGPPSTMRIDADNKGPS